MNSWESRFSMLLLKGAAATSLRSSSRSARGLWDALSPAGAGRREWAEPREPPVLGGLRAAGGRRGLTPRSGPHALYLIARCLSFSRFTPFTGASKVLSAASGSAPGLQGGPAPSRASPGSHPLATRRTGGSTALLLSRSHCRSLPVLGVSEAGFTGLLPEGRTGPSDSLGRSLLPYSWQPGPGEQGPGDGRRRDPLRAQKSWFWAD